MDVYIRPLESFALFYPVVSEFLSWSFQRTWEALNNLLTKKILHCWHNVYPGGFVCFYGKSKMAAGLHNSCRLTAEEVLEEVFAERDPEFSDKESKMVLNIMAIALALKKMMKVVKKAKVLRNMTAEVLVKTVKVRRKMQHLIEVKEEEGANVVEEEVVVVGEIQYGCWLQGLYQGWHSKG